MEAEQFLDATDRVIGTTTALAGKLACLRFDSLLFSASQGILSLFISHGAFV